MSKVTKSEDRELLLIGALLEVLAARSGLHYQVICRPDRENRQNKACDVIAKLGDCQLAIEHTSIDSMPDQRGDNARLRQALGPLEKDLSGKMPRTGYFLLLVDFNAISIGTDWMAIRRNIGNWCLAAADELELDPPKHFVKAQPDGVPFEVTLFRNRSQTLEGQFRVSCFAPGDLEERRTQVLRKCLCKRGQKVARYRTDGYKTVLLLESGLYDISLANHQDIHRALITAASVFQPSQLPDEVYLIETIPGEYLLHRLNFGNAEVETLGVWNTDKQTVILWRNV